MKKMGAGNTAILVIGFIIISGLILPFVDENASGRQAVIKLIVGVIMILVVLVIMSIAKNKSSK